MKLELPTLPPEIGHAKAQALWLLYEGSGGGGCDMTWSEAIEVLNTWAGTIFDGYFDEDGYEQEHSAVKEGWAWCVDRRNILEQYLGSDLMPYIE